MVSAVGSIAAVARAEAAGAVDVSWSAPPDRGCPSEAEVRASVERVVGNTATREGPKVRASAHVEQVGEERFRVKLETRTGDVAGTRVLEERSCRALSDAVVVILGWMVSPDAGSGEAQKPASETEPEPPPVAAEPRRAPWRPTFGMLALVDGGSLPSAALGVTARLGLARDWFRFGAYATWFPEREYATALIDQTTVQTTAGASLSLFAAGVEACLVFAPTPLFACAAAELEHVWGRGFGVDEPSSGSATWPAFTPDAGVTLLLVGRLSLQIRGGPVVPLVRPTFGLDGVGEVYQPAVVGLRAGAGFFAVF